MTNNRDRFNLFDLLRFIAATMVIYGHSYPLLGLTPPDLITRIFPFADSGALGVYIFFSISGFLNAKSVVKNKATVFYINRSLRIFPGLFVALLFAALVVGPLCTALPLDRYIVSPQTWRYITANSVLSPNYALPGVFNENLYKTAVNGSLWTLPTEFALYLILPLAVKALDNRLRATLLIAAGLLFFHIISVYISGYAINTFGLGPLEEVSANAFFFFAGASVAYSGAEKSSTRQLIFLSLLLLFTGRAAYGSIAFLIIFPMLVIKIGSLETRRLKLKNDISYGIYIYAFPVQQTVWHFFNSKISPVVMMLLSMLVTFVLALISWHFIEKPILANRESFASKLAGYKVADAPDARIRNDRE